jgi:Putative Ig domain
MRIITLHAQAAGLRAVVFSVLVLLAGFGPSIAHAANQPPTIYGTPPTYVKVNSYYTFLPGASDPDDVRNSLRFTVANKPSWAAFSQYSGRLTGVPTAAGTWSNIRITVSDGEASATLRAFTISTSTSAGSTGNRAPTISGTPPTSATVGTAYSFRPTASDADGNTLGFSITNRPSWMSFNTSTGTLSGTPTTSNVGTFSNIVIRVSDGSATASLPAFTLTVRTSGTSNGTPVISGTPTTSVRSGIAYSFTPTASDPNGDPLTFSIQNRPSWATFSTSNGRLYGTPTSAQIGTYSNIVIRVSDGRASAALPAFAITVSDTANGSATLTWTPPTRNTNGTTLTNLAGYRIYYGTSASAMNQRAQIANPGTATYVINNLSPATWYFTVRAYTSAGVESSPSSTVSKTVR